MTSLTIRKLSPLARRERASHAKALSAPMTRIPMAGDPNLMQLDTLTSGRAMLERRACQYAAWIAGNFNSFDVSRSSGHLIDTTEDIRDRLDAAAQLMDDDLREAIHSETRAECPHWFLAEYGRRHLEKFGQPFAPA